MPTITSAVSINFTEAPPPLTESRARELIRHVVEQPGQEYCWYNFDCQSEGRVALDGSLTADELEAFAWWLRNKAGEEP